MELTISEIKQQIYKVRGVRVMLDSDLACLFQTETRTLNQTVRRNAQRFPEDFMFQLRKDEFESLISQKVTAKPKARGGRQNLPLVFTEIGVGMLSGLLNNDRAVQVAIAAMRAFSQSPQIFSNETELTKKFEQLEQRLDGIDQRYGQLESRVSQQFELLHTALRLLLVEKTPSKLSPKLVLADPLKASQTEVIQKAVAEYFGARVQNFKLTTRRPVIAVPRQVAMYLIRRHTGMGFKEIGTCFGGKDHTTVLHAYQKIEACLETDSVIRIAIETIQGRLSLNA